ncbi:MAG TPA: XdhC family protein [Vicinamibacteria bacterium]|nr:XdhC family protein [Vicinamibacteria bacterium]
MNILEEALRLEKAGEPFVIAIVVRAVKPTSAKPGAKAIITETGGWIGWIGGSCSRPAVAYEARKVLASGEARLLQLSPDQTCASGGALDIYLEPHVPKPHLIIVGHLPVAEALCSLGKPLGFRVTAMSPEAKPEQFPAADVFVDRIDFSAADGGEAYIVIASHGSYDEEAIRAALGTEAGYIALVASKKRASALLDDVADRDRVKTPAGLDIGAVAPEEIALSILAEIVAVRRSKPVPVADESGFATDPVCGMTVEIAHAGHILEVGSDTYYFCGSGCKERFSTHAR